MAEQDLLFYNEYESFYAMVEQSNVYGKFCERACGRDFSQDGFSDISQVERIAEYIPDHGEVHILDIGCGNGKMVAGLRELNNTAHIFVHGFDYSNQAIQSANHLGLDHADFRKGIMGEIEYPACFFDVITSMDTIYFAKDMTAFVAQILCWLKDGGVFICGYQEGDVMPKTGNENTTELARAFRNNGITYEVSDITEECYTLLKRKRDTALSLQDEFAEAGEQKWYDMLMGQTESATRSWEEFRENMARYIYVVRK